MKRFDWTTWSEDAATRDELRGFARSVAELEWLVVVTVMLHASLVPQAIADPLWLVAGMGAYVAFVIVWRYSSLFGTDTRLKIALEVWVMMLFVTWAVALSWVGRGSVLMGLYLVPAVVSGVTLPRWQSALVVAGVAGAYFGIPWMTAGSGRIPLQPDALFAGLMPVILVAYVTSLLAADIHYARRTIRALARSDDLTGLVNLRAFRDTLERESRRAARFPRPYALLMVDADRLKEVNDGYGHETGNRLLQAIADAIAASGREIDTAARYGGDEFVMLLVGADAQAAVHVADRIRARLEQVRIEAGGDALRPTVSIGIASFPAHGENGEQVLTAADRALYLSKGRGRDCVSVAAARQPEHSGVV